MQNQIIKDQFNKQAQNFSNWEVSQNQEYLKAYFDFCELKPNDILLDVACGPGEFSVFCAKRIKKVVGIDISENEIEIGRNYAKDNNLNNIEFFYGDVEKLPFSDHSFSFVTCKSAFHHFRKKEIVMGEMVRCVFKGGNISTQDICAYENEKVNEFFENLDKEIDISHNRALRKNEFTELFQNNGIEIVKQFALFVDLNINEYLNHAVQTAENLENINNLLYIGLNDPDISCFLFYKGKELFFKREVFLVLGKESEV